MPAYTSMFVSPEKWERPDWASDIGDSLKNIGEGISRGVSAVGEGAVQAGEAIGQSFQDFQAGLPEAGRRIKAAGNAIGQSSEAVHTSLAAGTDGSEFVATSQTFGVEEAITILLTGGATGEAENFRRRRDEIEPLIDIELTEDQQVIAGAIAVVVIGAIIIATAPVSLPLLATGGVGLILAGSVGMTVFVAWEMFGDQFWDVLGKIGEVNPRGV